VPRAALWKSWVCCIALPCVLFGLGVMAQWCYQRRIANELAYLEQDLRRAHSDSGYRGAEYSRFGTEVSRLEQDLFVDLNAWVARRWGCDSILDHKLDYDIGCGVNLSHAYSLVAFHFQKDSRDSWHTFVWSPRLGRFVHHQNWGTCLQSGCSWCVDPRR
jgi:hypothetical protein